MQKTLKYRPLLAIVTLMIAGGLIIAGCAADESNGLPLVSSTGSEALTSAVIEKVGDTAASLPVNVAGAQNELESYEGLPVGFTEEGNPFRGEPDAPITLIEYSDYLCPFCGRYFNQTLPTLIESYGKTGQVNFVFRDFPLAALHPTAPVGHAAALCVAEQGPALFWEMHDALFANQDQWSHLGDPSEYVNGLAESIGVDMDTYNDCMAAGGTSELVNQSASESQALGFGGTPTFQIVANESGQIYPLVGAQPLPVFSNMLDTLLAGEELPDAQTQAAEASQLSEEDRAQASQITFDFDDELETYEGLPVGFTEEGYPFLGNPEAAVSLIEFSDYLCPFCGRHFNQTYPTLIQSYGASGEVNFVFRDYPLASLHPTAHFGHEGALCAGQQGADLYWAMHDQLFAAQNQWANLPDPTEFVAGLAEGAGADTEAYDDCIADGRASMLVEERVAEGEALGFSGTPTFQVLVNDTGAVHGVVGAQPLNVFSEMLDALIAGEELPEPEEPEPPELPLWASADGLAPDPERPGYTLAGDPYKGNADAAVVVVEFSDFQCPACQQHALEIQPALDQSLVDSGDVMWVFKPLPLREHSQAIPAAVAAECAGEQGNFWEMHHRLFKDLEAWAVADVDDQLLALAEEEGLDMETFSACYNGREALQRVVGDMYDSQGVAQTTPTFVVLRDGRGTLLEGSRPVDAFTALLKNFLEEVNESG